MAEHRWIFTKEEIANTPSRKCGIDSEKELNYRQQAANLIQDMGQRLLVTQLCINTAIVYMHRFYMFHSFTKFHRNSIAAAALFLAAKVEEQPRKLEHVIKVCHMLLSKDQLDTKSEAYLAEAHDLVVNENILLQTLGFDITVDHPHGHVVRTCTLVKASKDLAQTSYFLATNSLHLTQMCLLTRSTVIACVCMHLACKWSDYQIPRSSEDREWYFYVDKEVTAELLEELTQEFLAILDRCPSKLKKKILTWKAGGGREDNQMAGASPNVNASRPPPPPPPSAAQGSSRPPKEEPGSMRRVRTEPILQQVGASAPAGASVKGPVPSAAAAAAGSHLTPKEYLQRRAVEKAAEKTGQPHPHHSDRPSSSSHSEKKRLPPPPQAHTDKAAKDRSNIFDKMQQEPKKEQGGSVDPLKIMASLDADIANMKHPDVAVVAAAKQSQPPPLPVNKKQRGPELHSNHHGHPAAHHKASSSHPPPSSSQSRSSSSAAGSYHHHKKPEQHHQQQQQQHQSAPLPTKKLTSPTKPTAAAAQNAASNILSSTAAPPATVASAASISSLLLSPTPTSSQLPLKKDTPSPASRKPQQHQQQLQQLPSPIADMPAEATPTQTLLSPRIPVERDMLVHSERHKRQRLPSISVEDKELLNDRRGASPKIMLEKIDSSDSDAKPTPNHAQNTPDQPKPKIDTPPVIKVKQPSMDRIEETKVEGRHHAELPTSPKSAVPVPPPPQHTLKLKLDLKSGTASPVSDSGKSKHHKKHKRHKHKSHKSHHHHRSSSHSGGGGGGEEVATAGGDGAGVPKLKIKLGGDADSSRQTAAPTSVTEAAAAAAAADQPLKVVFSKDKLSGHYSSGSSSHKHKHSSRKRHRSRSPQSRSSSQQQQQQQNTTTPAAESTSHPHKMSRMSNSSSAVAAAQAAAAAAAGGGTGGGAGANNIPTAQSVIDATHSLNLLISQMQGQLSQTGTPNSNALPPLPSTPLQKPPLPPSSPPFPQF